MVHYLKQGCQVYTPFVQQSCVDLVIERESLLKVQVKSACWQRNKNNLLYLHTTLKSGKIFDGRSMDEKCDLVVIIHDGTVWEIPASDIGTRQGLNLASSSNNPRGSRWDKYKIN